MAKFGRQTCLLHKLCFRQNPIINFRLVNRALCNSIPHKVNTTFHLISSVSRMSLTFFRPQLITVIHSLVLQLWFFFFPATTNQCKCNARRSLRSSSQTPAFNMCHNCLGKFPSTVLGHLPALYQGDAAPSSLVFPESQIPCQIKHRQQAGTAGNMGCRSSKLGEEPTGFLPPAAAQSGHNESSSFWHPHWQALEHKGTRTLQMGPQHLQHSSPLPEPLSSTESVCSCNPPRESAEALQLCHYCSTFIFSSPA